jgi:hypothetical protein
MWRRVGEAYRGYSVPAIRLLLLLGGGTGGCVEVGATAGDQPMLAWTLQQQCSSLSKHIPGPDEDRWEAQDSLCGLEG